MANGFSTATKEHKCNYCGLPIHEGNQYVRTSWFDGARYTTGRFHPYCLRPAREAERKEKEAKNESR